MTAAESYLKIRTVPSTAYHAGDYRSKKVKRMKNKKSASPTARGSKQLHFRGGNALETPHHQDQKQSRFGDVWGAHARQMEPANGAEAKVPKEAKQVPLSLIWLSACNRHQY